MPRSIWLALYLAITARVDGWVARKLSKRLDQGKEDPDRIEERQGISTLKRPDGPLVWFHAASVGEALSVQELIRRMLEERADLRILITTGTRTSAELLEKRLPKGAVHQFVPVDTAKAVRRFLDHWHPDIAIWVESELWPRLIYETNERGIPMMLLNARMSRDSYENWRWVKGFATALLRRFDLILAQEGRTGKYLRRLGADPDRLSIIGTLKEGAQVLPCNEADLAEFSALIDARPVWLAASTHPGEEELVTEAHAKVLTSAHRLLLLLVPRHPERGPEIANTLRKAGWEVALRSDGAMPEADTQIYVADTLGELGLWYRSAPVSFIGGSLVEIGGHNPFEPAALGSAIIYGPHVTNFKDVYDRLTEANACRLVGDVDTLAKAVDELLAPDKAAAMAHAAWEVSSRGAEVTDRALDEVFFLLDRPAPQIADGDAA